MDCMCAKAINSIEKGKQIILKILFHLEIIVCNQNNIGFNFRAKMVSNPTFNSNSKWIIKSNLGNFMFIWRKGKNSKMKC